MRGVESGRSGGASLATSPTMSLTTAPAAAPVSRASRTERISSWKMADTSVASRSDRDWTPWSTTCWRPPSAQMLTRSLSRCCRGGGQGQAPAPTGQQRGPGQRRRAAAAAAAEKKQSRGAGGRQEGRRAGSPRLGDRLAPYELLCAESRRSLRLVYLPPRPPRPPPSW